MNVQFNGQGFHAEMGTPGKQPAGMTPSGIPKKLFRKTGCGFWFGLGSFLASQVTVLFTCFLPIALMRFLSSFNFGYILKEILNILSEYEDALPSEPLVDTSIWTEQLLFGYALSSVFALLITTALAVIAIVVFVKTKSNRHPLGQSLSWEALGLVGAILGLCVAALCFIGFLFLFRFFLLIT